MTTSSIPLGAPMPLLTRWGLTPDADLVFRTLATCGPDTAGNLAKSLGMARKRVDDALEDLYGAESVVPSRQAGLRGETVWGARPADSVVHQLRRRQHRAAVSHGTRCSVPRADTVELGPEMRHLTSRDKARKRMAVLLSHAHQERLTLNPEQAFEATSLRAAAQTDRQLSGRLIPSRVVGVLPPDPDRMVPFGGESTRSSVAYRAMPEVPMKLIVLDRKVAFFPVDPRNYERGYLEVAQASLVASLVETFERCWSAARSPQEVTVPAFALTPREEALVNLLVQGLTDAGAAQQLQISERTVSNLLRSLMDRLGVENRFQLGVALGSLRVAQYPTGSTAQPASQPNEEHDS
ncbi:helix-turn-helix transcriptional regulator [Catellatospora tritici]|uniref:helix-turn-helix transcriptional regulator n=1 Tax=Catellatospora tritici TaxID=2851566 RepID=UPI001C2CFFC0|nr:LuxR C-terminal-related transcriptional regulator [Catellatospora tritici]MBV1851941.1 LuxR C-terminal-related transcriptional regulator [Catellatospora tritici]